MAALKETESMTLSQLWLKAHMGRKKEAIDSAFGDDPTRSEIAQYELRIAYGLAVDPDPYNALIEWAHDPSKNPDPYELSELDRQGF